MTKFLTHCDSNSGIFHSILSFFVCLKLPFVGSNSQDIVPLIRKNIPSVHIRGFTLIELMVTLAVAAILVTVAAPSFRTFIQNGRITTQTNDLLADINFARSEAIRRSRLVGICPINPATNQCAVGGNWANGRLVFVDSDNNGAWTATDEQLRLRTTLTGSNTMVLKDANNPLFFGGRGTLAGGVLTNGTNPAFFLLCDTRGASKGKRIFITFTGQTRSDTNAPASCT